MESEIITMSGYSGAGKSFLVDKITKNFPEIREITGVTTRPIREGEIDGKSSYYFTIDKFDKLASEGQFEFVKEIFGNKYAWLKKDLLNEEKPKIMNISYETIEALRNLGLNIHAIFIRPYSEEKLKEILKLRLISSDEYEKRIQDYYDSETFIARRRDHFNTIFENQYDSLSCKKMLKYIKSNILSKNSEIEELLSEDIKIESQIILANELLSESEKSIDIGSVEYDESR